MSDLRARFAGAERVCVFGAGYIGMCAIDIFNKAGINVDMLCDNDSAKWGKMIAGLACYSPQDLDNYGNGLHVVVATNRYSEVLEQLKHGGYDIHVLSSVKPGIVEWSFGQDLAVVEDNVLRVADMLQDDRSRLTLLAILQDWSSGNLFNRLWESVYFGDEQYYPSGILSLNDRESFVDCGAYTGDSLEKFLHHADWKFRAIHAFEMSENNFRQLQGKYAGHHDKIHIYPYGVWDKTEEIEFREACGATHIDCDVHAVGEEGESKRAVLKPLDDVLVGEPVTLIKMDIEGAEMHALRGAQRIIREQQPKLAISIYHKLSDLYEIPFYIKSLAPEYRLYFRHHTYLDQDTVCYAIP